MEQLGALLMGGFILWLLAKNFPLQFFGTLSGIGVIALFVWWYRTDRKQRQEEEAKRRWEAESLVAKEAAARAAVAAHKRQQEALLGHITKTINDALTTFESMPPYLAAADQHLAKAEGDFEQRAFAPFWDSIELATHNLANFEHSLRIIKAHSERYANLSAQFESPAPSFAPRPNSIVRLGTGSETASRLSVQVSRAQRDFQFATIYEQRKTNKILVAGFTSLNHAVSHMSDRLDASLADVCRSVDNLSRTTQSSAQSIHNALDDISTQSAEFYAEHERLAGERSQREVAALEMLDNIQRRRRPILPGFNTASTTPLDRT